MKLSDRDKKLILGIILIAIIVLPIFLFIRPKIDSIKGLDAELDTLNERYNYLKDLDSKRPFYESEIARLTEERKDLVKGFAKGILQENTIMFLRDAELSFPIEMSAETFGEYQRTDVDAELTALTTRTSVAYSCEYSQIKDFIDYIFSYSDKMTIPSITMKYKSDTGRIEGTFDVSEFAFINDEEQVERRPIPAIDRGGNEAIFADFLPVIEGEEEEEEVAETPVETGTETEVETTED